MRRTVAVKDACGRSGSPNSRGRESLAAPAAETDATAPTVEQIASARDVVIVTIPQKAVPERPRGLFAGSIAVVVGTGNYTRRATGASTR